MNRPAPHRVTASARLAAPLVLGALALSLAACAKKPPQQLPPEPGPAVTTTAPPPPQGPAPGSQADFLAQMMGQDTIHFAFDKSDLDDVATAALRAQAAWLTKYPAKQVTIEGHCDERGTRDYNLALGERRATAAKNFLIGLGVDAARLKTVSYGKERPLDTASNEAAWAKNRRAVTITID